MSYMSSLQPTSLGGDVDASIAGMELLGKQAQEFSAEPRNWLVKDKFRLGGFKSVPKLKPACRSVCCVQVLSSVAHSPRQSNRCRADQHTSGAKNGLLSGTISLI